MAVSDWTAGVADVPTAGLIVKTEATAAERAVLASDLKLIECSAFALACKIRPVGGGRYQMKGTLSAKVTQACVVTLDPVPGAYDLAVEAEFTPDADRQPSAGAEEEAEVLALPELEPIPHGRLEYGRVAFETLAAGLNPYPRKPDAAFAWEDQAVETAATHPFAALAKLIQER